MKKKNIYVKCKSQKEADFYQKTLISLGESVSHVYEWGPEKTSGGGLYFNDYFNNWCIATVFGPYKLGEYPREQITFGQLIDLLNEPKKIAIKVDNEKEFKALMKYYDSLEWKWNGGLSPFSSTSIYFPNIISYEDNFMHGISKSDVIYEGGQIIPFSEFAKEHGIKLPLLTSEDGVDLYDDSDIHIVWKENFGWYFDNSNKGFKCDDGSWYVNPEIKEPNRKLFSTKQAALEWIEAQNPKLPEYVTLKKRSVDEYTNTVYSTHLEISGDFIGLINTGKILRLDKYEIEQILYAMNHSVKQS